MACGEGVMMEGTLTLWLPNQWSKFDKHRHPYQVSACTCIYCIAFISCKKSAIFANYNHFKFLFFK